MYLCVLVSLCLKPKSNLVLVTFPVLAGGLSCTNASITFSGFTSKRTVALFSVKKQRPDGKDFDYLLKEYAQMQKVRAQAAFAVCLIIFQ